MDDDFREHWERCGLRVHSAGPYDFAGPDTYGIMRRDHWCLLVVQAGRAILDHVRRRQELKPGDACLLPPDTGSQELVPAEGLRRYAIDFAVFAAPGYGNPLGDLDLPRVVRLPGAQEAVAAIDERFDGFRPRDAGARLAVRGMVDRLLTAYIEALPITGVPDGSVAPAWLGSVGEVMERHLRDPDLDLAAIATAVGVSVTRLSHAYRERYGLPPKAALRRRRMNRAAYLLQNNPDLTIADVAARCGYRSASLLARHFRRAHGCSPTAFRRRRPEQGAEGASLRPKIQ